MDGFDQDEGRCKGDVGAEVSLGRTRPHGLSLPPEGAVLYVWKGPVIMSGMDSVGSPKPPIQNTEIDKRLESAFTDQLSSEAQGELVESFESMLTGKSQGAAHASEQGLAHGVGLGGDMLGQTADAADIASKRATDQGIDAKQGDDTDLDNED